LTFWQPTALEQVRQTRISMPAVPPARCPAALRQALDATAHSDNRWPQGSGHNLPSRLAKRPCIGVDAPIIKEES
jgi:hypothetical protein